MNPEDDFLSQFRKPPRPEFGRSLYQRLSKGENSMFLNPSIDAPQPSLNGRHGHVESRPARRWDTRLTLAAALIAMLLLVGVIAISMRPTPQAAPILLPPAQQEPTPEATAEAVPANPAITAENLDQLTRLAAFGQGYLQSIAWSPDGSTLALHTSVGIWIYSADDLSTPLYQVDLGADPVLTVFPIFSDDGGTLVYSQLGQIFLWDMETRQTTQINRSPDPQSIASIVQLALSPDGSLLAAADFRGEISILDVASGAVRSTINLFYNNVYLHSLDFNHDGTQLVISAADSPLLVLEDLTGEWQDWEGEPLIYGRDLQSEAGIQGIGFSPDGSRIIARVYNEVVLLDVATGEEVTRIDLTDPEVEEVQGGGGSKGGGGDLTFSPDGTQFATVDSQLRIWDIESGEARVLVEGIPGNPYATLGMVAFSPDWSRVAVVDALTLTLRLVDVATGDVLMSQDNHNFRSVQALTFTPDTERVVASSDSGVTRVWTLTDMEAEPVVLNNPSGSPFSGGQPVLIDPISGNITMLIEGQIHLVSPDSGEVVESWPLPDEGTGLPAGYGVYPMAYSPDGRWLAVGLSGDDTVAIYDRSSQERTPTILEVDNGMATNLTFNADGTQLALMISPSLFGPSVGGQQHFGVDLYAVGSWERVGQLEEFDSYLGRIAFSPQPGSALLVTSDNTQRFQLWDTANGERVALLSDDVQVNGFAFSPDGSLLAAAVYIFSEDGTPLTSELRFYDVATTELITALPGNFPASVMTFSADGALLCIGMGTGTVEVWGVTD
ncbi:MAG: WD40 repeat domain-containing protein [bacterium]|nr:WD40 repeat domain-containing protein [bacterium]